MLTLLHRRNRSARPYTDTELSQHQVNLPFQAIFYPMGYAVELSSTCAGTLETAARLWWRYPSLSDAEPVRIRIICGGSAAGALRAPSRPRVQGQRLFIVHGPEDFAVADLTCGFGFACLSQASISDPAYFRYHFLEPLAYVMQSARHFALIHASCISRNGRGILLCGDSGSGKTCLAYACARRGWDYVSGDAVHIVRGSEDRMVIGRPYEIRFRQSALELFPELFSAVPTLRANGKTDLELDTSALNIPIALHSTACHIVFLDRGRTAGIEKYPRDHTLRRLEETICYGDGQTRSEQRVALSNISRLPGWRLRYSDLGQAEEMLHSLLDGTSSC
jgi:hypothetical protein